MARPRTFDVDTALNGATSVFREHGYEGTSAQMLVDAMGIGRQSLYDTFGDKWKLYLSVVRRYVIAEGSEHRAALRTGERAIDGIRAMLDRVVRGAKAPCLGVSSIAEFGCAHPERRIGGFAPLCSTASERHRPRATSLLLLILINWRLSSWRASRAFGSRLAVGLSRRISPVLAKWRFGQCAVFLPNNRTIVQLR